MKNKLSPKQIDALLDMTRLKENGRNAIFLIYNDGLTQAQVARKLNLSKMAITKYVQSFQRVVLLT